MVFGNHGSGSLPILYTNIFKLILCRLFVLETSTKQEKPNLNWA